MKKLILIALSLSITSCGPSTEELEALAKKNLDIATVTCNIISESPTYDAAMRIKEVNLGREKIGEDLFLGKDKEIAESFVYGLCRELVINDPEYSNKLNEKILIAEQLRLKEKQEAEQLRLIAEQEAEQLKLEAEQLRIKQEKKLRLAEELEVKRILEAKNNIEIVNAEKTSISELNGNWIFITYWADWCPPCFNQLKEIELFFNKRLQTSKKNNLKVYGYNFDEMAEEELAFLAEMNDINIPLILSNPGDIWGIETPPSLPATYLINKKGEVINTSLRPINSISLGMILSEAEEGKNRDIALSSLQKLLEQPSIDEKLDFSLFVLRVHILSSLENAEAIADEIKKGGYPSFIEPLESNNDLHAVYVGPFLSKKEIKDNLKEIQNISESSQSEITRWKL